MPVKRPVAANGKCQATTKAGRQCAAPAVREKNYCSLHADPERAATLGRKGGVRNRKVYEAEDPKIPPPQNASDVMSFLANAMAEVRAGRMEPKLGTTLSYIGTSLLKAIEVADVDDRLKRVECHLEVLAQESSTTGSRNLEEP